MHFFPKLPKKRLHRLPSEFKLRKQVTNLNGEPFPVQAKLDASSERWSSLDVVVDETGSLRIIYVKRKPRARDYRRLFWQNDRPRTRVCEKSGC